MFDNEFLQKLSSRAAALFPAAEAGRQKLERELHDLLQGSLAKLNLVTREEFSAQMKVLERARLQIADLERKLAELEKEKQAAGGAKK